MKTSAIFGLISVCALTSILVCPVAQGQKEVFPKDEEITLVMTQTDRALVGYQAAVNLQERLMKSEAGVADDKTIIEGLRAMSKAIGKQPQKFNTVFGVDFIMMLDDASRDAALCTAEAIKRSVQSTVSGDSAEGESYLLLSQNCTAVSESFYTLSENASVLYRRYVKGEEALAENPFNTAMECDAALTKMKSQPKN